MMMILWCEIAADILDHGRFRSVLFGGSIFEAVPDVQSLS